MAQPLDPPAKVSFQQQSAASKRKKRSKDGMPRPRRNTSSLGADIRGDTGAPAVSTLQPMPTIVSPPLSPRSSEIRSSRPHSKRRKARSLLRRWKHLSFRHTWVNPLVVILIILSLYFANPGPRNPLHHAIFLSYPLSPTDPLIPAHVLRGPNAPTQYGKGPRDFAFVAFYMVVLSFTREFLMQRLIRPTAIYFNIRSRAKQARFMEQVYTAMYFSIFGPLGLYVMSKTPVWYFRTEGMFEDFPHRTHEGAFKTYYLLQASYWAQQAIVLCLQLEKPRKDFKELVGHHIVTLALIWLSYRFHFTYMGLAVYITHDISDFFLAVSIDPHSFIWPFEPHVRNADEGDEQTSKSLNYITSPLTVPYFALFMGIWIYLRHYLNLVILYATLTSFRTVGPYDLNWDTQQYKCWISQIITFSLLTCLQVLNIFWLYFVLRIAANMVFMKQVEDVRSSDEEEEEEVPVLANGNGEKGESLTAAQNGGAPREVQLEAKVNGRPVGENGSVRRTVRKGGPRSSGNG